MRLVQASVPLRPVGNDHVESVRWLLDLIEQSESELLGRLWRPEVFDRLHAGSDTAGRRLPAQGSVCAERLGQTAVLPAGVYGPSRLKRIVQAQAVATMRTLAVRDRVVMAQTGADGAGCGVSAVYTRGVRRQILSHLRRHRHDAGRVLRLPDVQDVPNVPRRARLGAVDAQFARLAVDGDVLVLSLKVPTIPIPTSRSQWRWIEMIYPLPAHVRGRSIVRWHLPELTLDRRGVLARFAYTESVPDLADPAEARTALGVDWSPGSLGATAAVTRDQDEAIASSYRGSRFDDRGLTAKLERLQLQGQLLRAKAARVETLIENAPPPRAQQLHDKAALLRAQAQACDSKRVRINRDLSWLYAQHVTALAVSTGSQIVAVEDLRSLEPVGRGRANNNRSAQSIRRKAVDAITHTAARAGIAVVEIPPRGTSTNCPGCDTPLTRPHGYHSAYCSRCRIGGNRDTVAAVNIGKRALLARDGLASQKDTTRLRARTVEHAPVRRDRTKTTPTPARPRHRRVRATLPHHLERARHRNTAHNARPTLIRRPTSRRNAAPVAATSTTTRIHTHHSHSPPPDTQMPERSASVNGT